MKTQRRSVCLLMALALLLCARPAAATQGTCDDWGGIWSVQYDNSINDIITIDQIIYDEASLDPLWLCWATGTRWSDNMYIQFQKQNSGGLEPNYWLYVAVSNFDNGEDLTIEEI